MKQQSIEVKGWNWGAFLLGGIWAIGNNTWIGLLCLIPYLGVLMNIILGIKGNEWAWKNKTWKDVDHFRREQKKWTQWAVGLYTVLGVLGIIMSIYIPKSIEAKDQIDNVAPTFTPTLECPGMFDDMLYPEKCAPKVSSQVKNENAKSVLKTFQNSVFDGCVKRAKTMGHVGNEVEKHCLCAAMVASQCIDIDILLQSGEIKMDNKEYIERVEKECSY